MRLIDQALKVYSQSLLSEITGLSRYRLNRLRESHTRSKSIYYDKLREALAQPAARQAVDKGKPLTRKDYFSPPSIRVETRDLSVIAKQLQKAFPGKSQIEIRGYLERDRYTRQQLAEALAAYRQAKIQAEKAYRRSHPKGQSLDEYIRNATKSDYKRLKDAFGEQRKTEKNRFVARLISRGFLESYLENYGVLRA